MKEYLFWYNETRCAHPDCGGAYIWYWKTKTNTLTEAIAEFVQFAGDEGQIVQVFVVSALH
jgi:hypothetical protein